MRREADCSLQNRYKKKIVEYFALTDVMETENRNIPVADVDITNVENLVENVENPLSSRKRPVENPVEEVDKILHKG